MSVREKKRSLEDAMAEALDNIDHGLAHSDVPLHKRPMLAAVRFVELFVTEVDETGSGKGVQPGELTNYATSKWFRIIYKETEKWYRDRFGELIHSSRVDGLSGVTFIRNTPYLLKVPMTTIEPDKPGSTIWVCFHDSVQPNENVLAWIHNGPNFSNFQAKDVKAAQTITSEIASKLRATRVALMGMGSTDTRVIELRDQILPSLESAGRHLVKADVNNVRQAHWDMQMACELVLKCLAQQRAGTFKETHDLFHLYDKMPNSLPPFARTELSKLPNWEEMTKLRYGGGGPITLKQAFRSYRATVTIVAATTGALNKQLQLGKARILIKRPPWMEDG